MPDLESGFRFYEAAFGFTRVVEPYPGVLVVKAGDTTLCLLAKAAGTKPSPNTTDVRRYDRHWTPVHLDLHVDDFDGTLARALAAGAEVEQQFPRGAKHGAVAFCRDPFGHGFCLLEQRS